MTTASASTNLSGQYGRTIPWTAALVFLAALFPLPLAHAKSEVLLWRTPDGGIQPQAAVDSDGIVHLIYFKGKPGAGDLFYVKRAPKDVAFSKPIQANSRPGSAIAVGTIRGGQLAVGGSGRVHVVWNGGCVGGV